VRAASRPATRASDAYWPAKQRQPAGDRVLPWLRSRWRCEQVAAAANAYEYVPVPAVYGSPGFQSAPAPETANTDTVQSFELAVASSLPLGLMATKNGKPPVANGEARGCGGWCYRDRICGLLAMR
jgi:hypothetical protein